MKIQRIIYLIIGIISLVLGIIGIVFPILPTTPFLLLTSYTFAKGSKRFHNWFSHTTLYKNHLYNFVTNRSMKPKTKISILVVASIMLLFPLILIDSIGVKIIITILYITKYYYFIFKIKTTPQ